MALMYFTPKSNIYYFLEEQLKQQDIIVSCEEALDSGFSLKVKHGVVSVKSIESANVKELSVSVFGLYNTIEVDEISLSSTAKAFIPLNVNSVDVRYSIFNPLNIVGDAKGEFGEADMKFNVVDRNLTIVLHPSKLMLKSYRSTLRNLKKTENGEYVYAKTF
jgi:hypothetical protein